MEKLNERRDEKAMWQSKLNGWKGNFWNKICDVYSISLYVEILRIIKGASGKSTKFEEFIEMDIQYLIKFK